MLWTIFVILLVLWLLGLVGSYTMGGLIHLLLVLAVIVLIFQLLSGKSVVGRRALYAEFLALEVNQRVCDHVAGL